MFVTRTESPKWLRNNLKNAGTGGKAEGVRNQEHGEEEVVVDGVKAAVEQSSWDALFSQHHSNV